MGLIDYLDRMVFGKKCVEMGSNSEYKEKVEEREYENDAFHVKYIKKNGFCREKETTESTIEGKVIGFGEKDGEICFVLKTQKGTTEVFFPEKFSQDRKNNIKNKKIKYFVSRGRTSIPSGVNFRDHYRIDVLEGTLKGNFFEREVYRPVEYRSV